MMWEAEFTREISGRYVDQEAEKAERRGADGLRVADGELPVVALVGAGDDLRGGEIGAGPDGGPRCAGEVGGGGEVDSEAAQIFPEFEGERGKRVALVVTMVACGRVATASFSAGDPMRANSAALGRPS